MGLQHSHHHNFAGNGNSCHSPVVQIHHSTASFNSQDVETNSGILFFGGASSAAHSTAASADCLLESPTASLTAVIATTVADDDDSAVGGGDGCINGMANRGKESVSLDSQTVVIAANAIECPVCLMEKPKEDFPEIHTCYHRSCLFCLRQYFRIEIMESRVAIACPECSELFHPNDIKSIVDDEILTQKYEDFMLRRVLAVDPDTRWCPAPDCGYAVIASGCASCPKLRCERGGCNTNFCYHCKQYWHPNQTCDAARAERSPNVRSVSLSYSQESAGPNEIKSCPRCSAFIIKMDDESCNHMTCAVCEAHFCWLCLKEVSDLHYLSPSGCTFWGRKQWSRKKKILWQLGILVGAPVGITLFAGLAVPAMIIGIPVWVGKKVHYRYELASRRKRSLAVAGSVTASIFAAPVIATLAVGIGVPILLTYIYGVVPISLCRSGGCGVTTTNSGGVRFEFDEDNENATRGAYSYTGEYQGMETGPNVANPSIAPSIGDASLGMTNSLSASGSHMERVGVLRDDSDRDSSSHRAIAGTSINGSLCSATYSSQHHKLEVQADISEHGGLCERMSMGGESYNMSLNDDASTKALAGSLISPKDKDGVSVCSRLFDGNGNVAACAPLVYPEEIDEKESSSIYNAEVSASSSAYASGQQACSTSCPTSPNLRKSSSPTPSSGTMGDDVKNGRGKKCTRFMDQVPEIEDRKSEASSANSVVSERNVLGLANQAMIPITTSGPPLSSTTSLASTFVTSVNPDLNSCQSLASEEGSSENIVPGAAYNRLGKKAESTSVLTDSVESQRYEKMSGSGRKKGDNSPFAGEDGHCCCSRSGSTSLAASSCGNFGMAGGKCMEKGQHSSQPIHLSEISQVYEGMSTHHAAGCDDLLSVVDASSRSGPKPSSYFQHHRYHNSISSSSSSSMDDPVTGTAGDFSSCHRHKYSLGQSLEDVEEDLHSLNNTDISIDANAHGKECRPQCGRCNHCHGNRCASCYLMDVGDILSDENIINKINNTSEYINDEKNENDSIIKTKLSSSFDANIKQSEHVGEIVVMSTTDTSFTQNCSPPQDQINFLAAQTVLNPDINNSKRDSAFSSSLVSHTTLGKEALSTLESSVLPEVEVTTPGLYHPPLNRGGELLCHFDRIVDNDGKAAHSDNSHVVIS